MKTYKIVRKYFKDSTAPDNRVISTGLTLEEAQRHCNDPETSHKTCIEPKNRAHTAKYGAWYDVYYEEECCAGKNVCFCTNMEDDVD